MLAAPLSAQVYNVTRYTTVDDLVQSQVMALLQDQQGYLWFGTHRGACRFDGREFHDISPRKLAGAFLTDMWENPANGDLLFATQGGLTLFDGYNFTHIREQEGLIEKNVLCLLEDAAGKVWIGTRSKGLQWLDPDQPQQLAPPFPGQERLQGRRIQDMAQDQQGMIWIATDRGVFRCDQDGDSLQLWDQPELAKADVLALFWESERQALWLGTNRGAYLWRQPGLTHFVPTRHGGTDDAVYCFARDLDGQVWMGTRKGVLFLDGEGALRPLIRRDKSLDYHMRSAYCDQEGNIWFGTDGGGARKITKGVFQSYTMQEGLSSNLAKSFLQTRGGAVWISTRDRGINLYRGEEQPFQVLNSENTNLGGDAICYSYQDRQGRFWFTSYNGTLSRWEHGLGRFVVYDRDNGLDCNAVYVITEDPQGIIWIGTDNGLFRMVNDRITGRLGTGAGLPSPVIYSLHTDRNQRLWVGTDSTLAYREGSEFRTFPSQGSIGQTVIALAEDEQGRLWVGSSIGLACIEGDSVRKIHISNSDGAHTIVGLYIDRQELLWIATENGVYRLNLRQYDPAVAPKFGHFTQKDGLPSMECNANAIFEDRRGNIWIGTAEGAIRKSEGQERESSGFPPRVYITRVSVDTIKDWRGQPDQEVNDQGLPVNLTLPYSQNRIDFSYIGISLKSPQQIEYRYYLEGLDPGWDTTFSTKLTEAPYPNLKPGNYTFFVTAKKEEEPWDYDRVASFSFTILPPFYARAWFILLVIFVVAGAGLYAWFTISERRRRQREERRLRNNAEKLQLEHSALYAMMNPHFTFNALNAIKLFIHRQDKKAADKFLSAFAKLVRMNLESTRSDFITLEEELKRLELFLELAKVRFPEKFERFEVAVEDDIGLMETKIPPMLLQPFVENSIEHGIKPLEAGGVIRVEVSRVDDEYLRIRIRDNGIGLEASRKAKAHRPKDHVSRGMQITKDRLKLFARITGKQYSLDIREVKSETDETAGTLVEMILPIKEDATMFV